MHFAIHHLQDDKCSDLAKYRKKKCHNIAKHSKFKIQLKFNAKHIVYGLWTRKKVTKEVVSHRSDFDLTFDVYGRPRTRARCTQHNQSAMQSGIFNV